MTDTVLEEVEQLYINYMVENEKFLKGFHKEQRYIKSKRSPYREL